MFLKREHQVRSERPERSPQARVRCHQWSRMPTHLLKGLSSATILWLPISSGSHRTEQAALRDKIRHGRRHHPAPRRIPRLDQAQDLRRSNVKLRGTYSRTGSIEPFSHSDSNSFLWCTPTATECIVRISPVDAFFVGYTSSRTGP